MDKFKNLEIDENKERVAILVVGYNRLTTLQRLVESLKRASYIVDNVPLVFCIDASNNKVLYEYVKSVEWKYGPKYVIIQENRLGLKKHIYFCGDISRYFKGVIILEDDVIVSESFYSYTVAAVDKYYNVESVAGIALFADAANGYAHMLPISRYQDGSDGYMLQEVCTSGECFTDKMWSSFRNWMSKNEKFDSIELDIPDVIKKWHQAWSKLFNYYIKENDKFFLTPYVSYSSNCGDAGVHSKVNLNFLHTPLCWGRKQTYYFKDFPECEKYDMYGNMLGLGKYLNIDEGQLCVDLYGNNNNCCNKRYYLSIKSLPYNLVKSFGLVLEPVEANVIYDIPGDDIFLYDTNGVKVKIKDTQSRLSYSQLSYFLRGLDYKYCWKYVIDTLKNKIKQKLSCKRK